MEWSDIAGIVFTCVTMNHLGLIKAVEEATEYEFPILNCPKCSTMWLTLVYMLFASHEVITSLAISFLCSYSAIWLELFEGFIDSLYTKLYEKIYQSTADHKTAAGSSSSDSAGSLP